MVRRHQNTQLSPWLDGLLPDRSDVLNRWRSEFRVRDQTTFALLRHVGEDVAGAAQFVRPERVAAASLPGPVMPLRDEDIADRLRLLASDPAAWEPATGISQFSLSGVQPKFALHHDGDQWGLPTGRTPTTHVIKPAIQGMLDQDLNEHLTMRAGKILGLTVPDTEVRFFGDERALVVTRFDRVRTSDGWLRVHQEDMCQAIGLGPDQKYESNGGPSAVSIARLIRRSVAGDMADRDVSRSCTTGSLSGQILLPSLSPRPTQAKALHADRDT